MTLLQALKTAARVAAEASYDGRVTVEKFEDGEITVREYTDYTSYTPGTEELYSFDMTKNEPEGSMTALYKWAREDLNI